MWAPANCEQDFGTSVIRYWLATHVRVIYLPKATQYRNSNADNSIDTHTLTLHISISAGNSISTTKRGQNSGWRQDLILVGFTRPLTHLSGNCSVDGSTLVVYVLWSTDHFWVLRKQFIALAQPDTHRHRHKHTRMRDRRARDFLGHCDCTVRATEDILSSDISDTAGPSMLVIAVFP